MDHARACPTRGCILTDHRHSLMHHAVRLSAEGMRDGAGGPFGAVIVKEGAVIAEGWNRVTSAKDPTAHAEISAIRLACERLDAFSLEGCEIYTTCEPCPMCLAAIYWARLDRIYYANSREDAAAIGFDDALIYAEVSKPLEGRSIPIERLEAPDAKAVLTEWRTKLDRVVY